MPKLPDARTPFHAPGGVHSFIVPKDQLLKVDANDAPNLHPTTKAGAPVPASGPSAAGTTPAAGDSFEAGKSKANQATQATTGGRPPATPHLVYWGGKVLTQPKVVNVFVGDYWNSDAGKADAAHMNGFADTFGKSGMFDMLSPQYGVGRPEFKGSTVVPGTVTKMTTDDVQAAVKKAIAAGGLATDPETVYSIQLPPGAVLSDGNADSTQGLGGFHGSYTDPATNKPVYYAAIAYADGQNGIAFSGSSRDNNTITLSHELVEAITDPDVAQAKQYGDLGYMDPLGGEIGDLAVNDGAMPLNEAYARNAAGYAVQVEWDNNSGSFGISPLKTPKIVTTTGHNPINAKLGTTESQSQVVLHSAVDINKLMLNVTLDNPKGGRPMLTLTSPSGQAIPINLPPVANFHGSLDLSPFIAGSNAKGNWVLSATDPGNSGITLKNWGLNASGIAEGAADVKN